MMQIMKDIGGVELPEYVARFAPDAQAPAKSAHAGNGQAEEVVAAAKKEGRTE